MAKEIRLLPAYGTALNKEVVTERINNQKIYISKSSWRILDCKS
ncbi:MAG: hypothetical protein JETT_1629 [Candidatus Jettenia ecosi]|uniref:Uncharacterized protein n=1 Tax=Candidatus Jettenia ecosi TaxID=2494326 RepID=A0A533QCI2_9BACT|nr:MAG: hypothetical protein JETT_1629 [Candidatus Jettenia ecosi]